MRSVVLLGAFVAVASPSFADPPPVAAPAPPLSPEEQKALEQALATDAAANAQKAPPPVTPASPVVGAIGRAIQSLNPDLSGIIDFAGGAYLSLQRQRDGSQPTRDGSDRVIRSGDDPGATGLNLQEVEVGLQATVDPYFRGDLFLTIPNARGIEVEEAYLTTTSLPWSLQLKAGIFRAAFGRQNAQHLHLQDFTRRPALNALLLGSDGLRAPGAELSLLLPLPFYLLLTGELLSVGGADPDRPLSTFGGGGRSDFTYLGSARTFAPISETTSLLLGFSFATGKTSQSATPVAGGAAMATGLDGLRSRLYGVDAYFKWKPVNVVKTYMSLGWTTEFILREVPFPDGNHALDGGLYSQLVWQVARRWLIGVRGEIDGIPSAQVQRQYAGSASLTWALSEFARVRLHGEARFLPDAGSALAETQLGAFLQLEASLGAHGAHPY